MGSMESSKGRVLCLEIENFKSYRGRSLVGPFKRFTTVIGPNGSGKSNLMDAISFVLGIRTGKLRGNNLRELLYINTDSQDPADKPDRGHVTLILEASNGEEFHFTRAIIPSSTGETCTSQYRVNSKIVTAEAYNTHLQEFNILVQARNSLVFQGDIENVAQMSPKDLTAMFETISGSGALREDYETAETAVKEAESAMTVVFSKRKAIAAEKRQKKEQKTEAERHMALRRELEEARVRQALWRVYHIQQDAAEQRQRARELRDRAQRGDAAASEAEAAVEAHRRTQAGVAKERLLLDKQVKKRRTEAEKQNPALIKAREAIAHAERRLKSAKRDGEAARKRAAEHETKIESLRGQLTGLEAAQKQVEEELAEAAKARAKNLSPELLEEYHAIKRELGVKTSKLEAEREALQAAADADAEALRMLQDAAAAGDERLTELTRQHADAEARLVSLEEQLATAAAERQSKGAEREKWVAERRRLENSRANLERKLEETEGQLREKKAEAKQSQREEALRALVEHLKRSFPGRVYGLVTDLAEVTAQRYRLAMSIVLGKDFDSVVVDTPDTAMQCIQIVKERRASPITFLPAETIRVKEVNPALRALGGTARLAMDTLNVKDDRAARALQAVCGATLLCDSVDEARQLAYGAEARHKVVACNGTAFLKTGLIMGGVTQAMEERARRWDDRAQREYATMKEQRVAIAKELAELPTLRQATEALQAAEAAVSRLDNSLEFLRADVRSTRAKAVDANSAMEALKREKEARNPDAVRLEKSISERNERVSSLQRRIDEVADRMFVSFSQKIGVKSIREYEGKHLKEAERLAERRVAVAAQIARVKNQLEYELKADVASEAARLETQVQELEKTLQDLREDEKRAREAAKAAEAELQSLVQQQSALKERLDGLEVEAKALKKTAREAADAAASVRRAVAAAASKKEQLRSALDDVLEAVELEGLTLPTLTGRKAVAAAQARGEHGDDESEEDDGTDGDDESDGRGGGDAMHVDGEGGGEGEGGPRSSAAGVSSVSRRTLAKRRRALFDYSVLNEDDRMRDAAARSRREGEMKATIEDTTRELEKMAPNLKAVEQYAEVKERERAQAEEVEAARRRCKEATDTFLDIRQRRFDLFNAALAHITSVIDPIYKELTRSSLHPSGGQAYLSPENAEEPFCAGIKFSAMPPTKRFRDMEQLSGGEKTVAALALLFAVHSFRPSPFFVLDEIDAALDSTNVGRVATYVRAKTRTGAQGEFQAIVISLKDTFYEKADALVGVCRDPAMGASATLTFDLERFPPPTGTAA